LATFKLAESTGIGNTDKLVFILYRRHDNLWTGSELVVETNLFNAIPGAGATHEFTYAFGKSSFNFSGNNTSGPAHFRFGMISDGATDDFDVEVSIVTSRLISQQAWAA
jgi:hypothetical protein